jgi:hypothetical protein
MTDRDVDVGTGAIRLCALFPNPGNVLRPGQYGRVRATVDFYKGAAVVPERAVSELQGSYQVAVVGNDNRVALRTVTLGTRSDGMWVVEEGVQPGERVIVEGLQRVRGGSLVSPKSRLADAVSAYQEAVDVAQQRYSAGKSSYFEVLDAQQQLFPAQVAVALVERDRRLVLVQLYQALGGGWNLTDAGWIGPKP